MIPDEAIAAGLAAWGQCPVGVSPKRQMANILEAAAPFIVAETAQRIADEMQSWAGPAERGYTQSFAETAAQQLPNT